MPRRARISYDPVRPRDFAPGVDNVHLRSDGVEFYAPDTFHTSPFYNKTTPVFACDIVRSKELSEVYGFLAIRATINGVVLLNNHPVRKVRLMGRISEYFIKESARGVVNYFLTIDDSSGEHINCKVPKSKFVGAGLRHDQSENTLVQLTGYVQDFDGKKEIHADFIEIMESGPKSLKVELSFWRTVITMRKILQTPWFQTPLIDDQTTGSKVRMDPMALRRKLMERNTKFADPDDEDTAVVLDSIILIRQKAIKKPRREAMLDRGEDAGTDSDSELEEITKEVFEAKDSIEIGLFSTPPRAYDSTWIALDNKKHPYRVAGCYTEQELAVRLFHWLTSQPQEKVPLHEALQASEISSYLNKLATSEDSAPFIDLESSQESTTSNTEDTAIHYFHLSRRILQRMGLIRYTKSNKLCTRMLKIFYKDIFRTLQSIKNSSDDKISKSLLVNNYIPVFNHKHNTDIEVNAQFINRLIYTILKSDEDKKWKFNAQRDEWAFEVARDRSRVLKAPKRTCHSDDL